ncbi:MAG TPA: hypothetical protein VHI52_13840, partial [Verrucomicrobiae bacterium]|nr:hypothetical protein [Verrucomicrobiae bacterium]
ERTMPPNSPFTANPPLNSGSMLEIEHCYSGFMGYPYVAWIWQGNTIVAVICRTGEGRYKVLNGTKIVQVP